MGALQEPLVAQVAEVAAHGGLRDPEQPGQLRHVGASLRGDVVEYPHMAVASQHAASIVPGGDFAQ
ncbi:hypothetical protein GCM10010349_59130 [Streptomyces flavofungini]|nr:hypothetical protein GCM10010349_59130 [Streptomyces flavofungini]